MRAVLAYPGNMAHAQHSARALVEAGALQAFVTTFVCRKDGVLSSLLARLPFEAAKRANRQLARRAIEQVPSHLVHSYPMWEMLRSGAAMSGAGPVVTDLVWDRMIRSFDALVARRYVPQTLSIHAFESAALAAFERAEQEGGARILHVPSLDGKQFEEIQQCEKRNWKELVGPNDGYFDAKFACRYDRRQREIALADVIIANSCLTARSHIASGADPAKTFVCPLGAPPPIAEVRVTPQQKNLPLSVIWAGPFSLRKGAHYLLDAWKLLNAKSAAILNIYGELVLPDRVLASATAGIVYHGSVPQAQLFNAFEEADILVFPTLSDGFGMVVVEAMARGLPVITTNQAGAADLVTERNGLIVPAADPKALADAFRWCLDNRERLQEMRLPALETARGRQWSHFRRDLIAALTTGLSRAGYSPTFTSLTEGAGVGAI
jgi:glycosyltransferase involved in cell wall biosynthesis